MTIYEEYAILEAQIEELENKKTSMRVSILEEMIKNGEKTVDTSVGKFTVTPLKKWTYPEWVTKLGEEIKKEISALEDKFKAEKAKAESTKEATYTESASLRFTKIKL